MSEPTIPTAGNVPVFPLPNTVFFPETVLPLHVFEPRYREMVRDAEAGDRRIAVALLKPGWESDYHGTPPIHSMATIGRIEDLVPLPDGRFNLRLVGLARIRLLQQIRATPYRLMSYVAAPEHLSVGPDEARAAALELLATQMCVARELGTGPREMIAEQDVSLAAAVNGASSSLPIDAAIRQRLLDETDLIERNRMVASILDRILTQLIRLRSDRDGGGEGGPESLH